MQFKEKNSCENISYDKKVTLKTIASMAGVSPSCVTRYINGTGYVSQKKREAIQSVIYDLDYTPSHYAKCLRGGTSNLIGYIYLARDENIFFSKLATRIERMSFENGYSTISIAVPDVTIDALKKATKVLKSYQVDGIILNLGVIASSTEDIEQLLKHLDVPLIMVERSLDIRGIDKVLFDNLEGSSYATQFLVNMGHRKIAYLGVTPNEIVEIERYNGYRAIMNDIDMAYADQHSFFVDSYSIENGYQKCKEILTDNENDRPTAIYAASDILAAGVYRRLHEMQIQIPDDISVVGFDDTLAQFLSPPLSTVSMPVEDLSESVLQLLIETIEKKTRSIGKKIMLEQRFINRNSVKKLGE